MEPYENVTIGNFLYSLGLAIGARCADPVMPGCVNLLQQSPLDKPLADVFLQYPGAMRLLEFKRSKNRSPKESRKVDRLRNLLVMPEYDRFVRISRAVHWFITTAEFGKPFDGRVTPYLDYDILGSTGQTTLAAFVDDLVAEAMSSTHRFSVQAQEAYLKFVIEWQGSEESDQSAGSGVIVMLDNAGQLHYLAVEDMRDLRRTHRNMIALQNSLASAFARDGDRVPVQEQEAGPQLTMRRRGPSLSR